MRINLLFLILIFSSVCSARTLYFPRFYGGKIAPKNANKLNAWSFMFKAFFASLIDPNYQDIVVNEKRSVGKYISKAPIKKSYFSFASSAPNVCGPNGCS